MACLWLNFRIQDCQVCGLDRACHGRNFEVPFCKAHGLCWACQWQNFRTADCQVCGLDWACHGRNFGTQVWKVCGGCWAWLGLPQVKVWNSRGHGWKFEAPFVKLMVFGGPASDRIAWACHRHNFGLPVYDSSGLCWACRCHGRNVLLVFELSCAQWVRFAGCAGRTGLLWLVSFVRCHLSPEVRWFGWIPWLGCLGAAAHCEMNGIYTSMFFVDMNVVPTSGGQ